MRSKIEANEYKDYILGFIFYKFLSDQEEAFLRKEGSTEDEIKSIAEPVSDEDPNKGIMEHCQKNLGYFISYKHLLSTWVKPRKHGEEPFTVGDVRDALNAFSRLIYPTHKKVFEGIFKTLQDGLSKLGESTSAQTKATSDLLQLIKDIPTDGSQDYDVLGFIYEYLISNFAANAGKKAGEFYTPHEVALLMAEIVAYHLRDREKIEIYDPTSGSGSLLLNIGRASAKHIEDKDQIKYYAQELKQNTYNLTRMNLVMRGIKPANIVTRNGDTLEQDWPMFDESDPTGTYHPLYVDAVVSNPPYSQEWSPKDKEFDPRYSRFGLAPKGTADYAFLLHDLFHIKPDGIMTIVLPHGVLFRGGEEEKIRMNLVENNHVDAVIGLPPNVFFGTGIPTLIMVLKQKRDNTDTLFIDASRCFEKVGSNNKLRASDIKRIADAYIERKPTDPTFAAIVSREKIRENGYNLNIPRYIEPSERPEKWDIYATMFGGIPKAEIDDLKDYWQAFPSLRIELFGEESQPYAHLIPKIAMETILENNDVKAYQASYRSSLDSFPSFLKERLIENLMDVNVAKEESVIAADIFSRIGSLPLVDKYAAFEILDKKWTEKEADNYDVWTNIASDLEVLQTEGFEAAKQVDPHMIIKKDKDNKEVEVQDGWVGHILPFNLVQTTLLQKEWLEWQNKEKEVKALEEELEDAPNSFDELDLKADIWSDEKNDFIPAGIKARVAHILSEVSSPEIEALFRYLELLNNKAKKPEKIAFISVNPIVQWNEMEASKDGTYAKSPVNKYIAQLQSKYKFPEDSLEARILNVNRLIEDLKSAKKDAKTLSSELQEKTRALIPTISDDDVKKMLFEKWIRPLVLTLDELPIEILVDFSDKIDSLVAKYADTLQNISEEKINAQRTLASLIDNLTGNEYDMQGMKSLKNMLEGK